MSIDDGGVVRGANAKAAELTGQPVERADRPAVRDARRAGAGHRPRRVAGHRTRRAPRRAGDVPPAARRRASRPRWSRRRSTAPARPTAASLVRLRDVTEREERVRALEQARRRFQQAFHSAPTGMALVRLDDSTILDANRSLAEMLARPVDELVGRSIREITHPEDLRAAAAYRARLELGIADTYLHRPALPAQRRRVRVGPHPRRGHRGRGRVAGDHPHRGRHRAAPHGRAAAVGGDPRRPHRAAQPHRADPPGRRHPRRRRAGRGRAAVHRPRQLQVGQRQPRPRHRRHVADGDVGAPARGRRRRRRAGPLRRRRVHRRAARPGPRRRWPSPRTCGRRCARPSRSRAPSCSSRTSIGVSVNDRDGTTAADLLRDADAAMYRAKARGRDCVEAFAPGHPRDDGPGAAHGDRAAPRHRARRDRARTSSRSSS